MGLYSVVAVRRLSSCPRCGHDGDIRVQIHYGDTRSHRGEDSYRIGDLIQWGGQDEGTPAEGTVEVLGFPECCPVCGLEADGEYALTGDPGQYMAEYVLTVKDGRITGCRQATAADVKRIEQPGAGG
jgi:hypothetical protein